MTGRAAEAPPASVLIYGFHPVREALRHRSGEMERLLVAEGRGGRRRRQIEELAARHGIAVDEVDSERLDALTGGVHNGFAATLRETGRVDHGADPGLVVLAEDVQDPRNLGALLRVCDGAGVGRVLVRDRGSAPLGATAVKTSAGAAEWLEVERITNTANEVARLKEDGFWVYGAAAEGRPPWEIDLTGRVALCVGGEEKGLRARTRSICDDLVGLPMRGRVASLNLATATAALLYEAVRQRAAAADERD